MVVGTKPPDIGNLTIDQFERMPEFDERYELIDGRVIKKQMPGEEHSTIADNLLFAIRDFDKQWKLGRAWREITVRIRPDERNGRIPDLSYVVANRRKPLTNRSLDVVPDLVVEVWSPSDIAGHVALESTREKMLYWSRNGVKITWCINPVAREVEVLYAGQEIPAKVLNQNDELDGENVLPGFKMKVAELFGQ